MVFPYADGDALERELEVDADRLGVSDEDWQQLVDDTLSTASERVETDDYAGVRYRDVDTTDDVPGILRAAVIRLARARIHAIESDSLESENMGDSASYNYKSLAEVRSEVRADLQGADLTRDDDDEGGHDTVRASLL